MTRGTSDYDWIDALIAASVASKETIFRDLYGQIDYPRDLYDGDDYFPRFHRPTTMSSSSTLTSEEILSMSKADSNGSSATDAQRLEAAKRKVGETYAAWIIDGASYAAHINAREAYERLAKEIIERKKAAEAEAARIAALPKLLDREEAANDYRVTTGFWTRHGVARGTCDEANRRAKAYYKSRYEEAKKGLTMTDVAAAALEAIFA